MSTCFKDLLKVSFLLALFRPPGCCRAISNFEIRSTNDAPKQTEIVLQNKTTQKTIVFTTYLKGFQFLDIFDDFLKVSFLLVFFRPPGCCRAISNFEIWSTNDAPKQTKSVSPKKQLRKPLFLQCIYKVSNFWTFSMFF